ncbi:nucleoside triphosphate pyrophosphohydrolase [Metabacillus fastidiosus]|uniref:nucleoside triphosphate pyrophosphohydrolase n=1 Tax=Metabacillus fastidiosus TaxID=1458 RepID=UPI003D2D3DF8
MAKKITVIGLGAGDINQLPLGIYRLITTAEHLFLRTVEHPVFNELSSEITSYTSFDEVYMKSNEFEAVYTEIVNRLYAEALTKDIIYAVPGHPLVAEQTVQLLLNEGREKGFEIEIVGGQSFLDATFGALEIDPIEGFQLLDALTLRGESLELNGHIVITQVYDQFVASDVKLTLMEQLPDEYEVTVVTAAGSKEQKLTKVPLYELDRVTSVNNLTSVYIPPVSDQSLLHHQFASFRHVIAELRGPNGCPWDQKQTHESLKKYLIEECYELIEAIDKEDFDNMIEELGDVLLQVVLHAQIGEDEGIFSMEDVIRGVTEKMIRRHPHVFGEISVENTEEVLINWEKIKEEEGKSAEHQSLLDSVSKALPALSRAYQLQKRAAKVGFDWPNVDEAWVKVEEELNELKMEIKNNNEQFILKEFGDLLFAIVNIGRFYKIEPEEALLSTNLKFYERFMFIEGRAREINKSLTEMTLDEMDKYWDEAKKEKNK